MNRPSHSRSERRLNQLSCILRASAASLFLTVGCSGTELTTGAEPRNVEARISPDIATVVRVSWTTDIETVGYVQFGDTAELTGNTALESERTREHTATLLGLRAGSQYRFRVVSWTGKDAAASEVGGFET